MEAQTKIKGVAALAILFLLSAVKQTSIGACGLWMSISIHFYLDTMCESTVQCSQCHMWWCMKTFCLSFGVLQQDVMSHTWNIMCCFVVFPQETAASGCWQEITMLMCENNNRKGRDMAAATLSICVDRTAANTFHWTNLGSTTRPSWICRWCKECNLKTNASLWSGPELLLRLCPIQP